MYVSIIWFITSTWVVLTAWYRPRCPLRSHLLVHGKKIYSVGIGPICDVNITYIFDLSPPFVRCIKDRFQYYDLFWNTHMFSNIVIVTLNYVSWLIFLQILGKCTFWKYIYIPPTSTNINYQQRHLKTLLLYHQQKENIQKWVSIRGQRFFVREITTLI